MVDLFAQGLLRRHRATGPEDRSLHRERVLLAVAAVPDALGETEIEDLGVAELRHLDVLGLEVPVHHALGVGLREPFADLPRQLEDLAHLEGALLDELLQSLAVHQLHHDPIARPRLHDVVHLDDGGMAQPRHRPRLPAQTLARAQVGLPGPDVLDGDPALQTLVARPVDDAHASRTDPIDDTVRTDALGQRRSRAKPAATLPGGTTGTIRRARLFRLGNRASIRRMLARAADVAHVLQFTWPREAEQVEFRPVGRILEPPLSTNPPRPPNPSPKIEWPLHAPNRLQ